MVAVPDFVAVGHVTKDILPDGGYSIGGTATYASLTVHRLGLAVGVFTSISLDLNLRDSLDGVVVHVVPSRSATTFENTYQGSKRRQYVHGTATPLRPSGMPAAWLRAPIALLCPIAGELNLEWLDTFPNTLVGVTPQGWMRQWDERGLVSPKPWCEADQILPRVDVLVYSEEDVACDEDLIQHYAKLARIAVVTRGPRGATVYWDGRPREFPAFRAAAELDPTGAGDVFAAAFLVRLKETGDPNVAAPFANSAASFAVEGPGTTTIPTRSQVEERLLRGQIITGRKPSAPGGDPTRSP